MNVQMIASIIMTNDEYLQLVDYQIACFGFYVTGTIVTIPDRMMIRLLLQFVQSRNQTCV